MKLEITKINKRKIQKQKIEGGAAIEEVEQPIGAFGGPMNGSRRPMDEAQVDAATMATTIDIDEEGGSVFMCAYFFHCSPARIPLVDFSMCLAISFLGVLSFSYLVQSNQTKKTKTPVFNNRK